MPSLFRVGLALKEGLQQLRGFPVRSAIAILTVAAGTAGITAVSSLALGLEETAARAFASDDRGYFIVRREPSYESILLGNVTAIGNADLRVVQTLPGVEHAVPVARLGGFVTPISVGVTRATGAIYGTWAEYLQMGSANVASGVAPSASSWRRGSRSCVIGSALASQLFAQPADALGKTVAFAGASCDVVALFQSPPAVLGTDPEVALIASLPFVRSLQRKGLPIDLEIHVSTRPGVPVDEVANHVHAALARLRLTAPGQEDFLVVTGEGLRKYLDDTLATVRISGYAFTLIVLAVAALGTANVMLSGVRQRTSEVAIKRAVGATRQDIFQQFLFETVVLTSAGGFLGAICGIALVWLLTTFHPTLGQFTLSVPGLAGALLAALVVGLATGVLPATRAAQMDPKHGLYVN